MIEGHHQVKFVSLDFYQGSCFLLSHVICFEQLIHTRGLPQKGILSGVNFLPEAELQLSMLLEIQQKGVPLTGMHMLCMDLVMLTMHLEVLHVQQPLEETMMMKDMGVGLKGHFQCIVKAMAVIMIPYPVPSVHMRQLYDFVGITSCFWICYMFS